MHVVAVKPEKNQKIDDKQNVNIECNPLYTAMTFLSAELQVTWRHDVVTQSQRHVHVIYILFIYLNVSIC